jgi:hypothetical protein
LKQDLCEVPGPISVLLFTRLLHLHLALVPKVHAMSQATWLLPIFAATVVNAIGCFF